MMQLHQQHLQRAGKLQHADQQISAWGRIDNSVRRTSEPPIGFVYKFDEHAWKSSMEFKIQLIGLSSSHQKAKKI